MVFFAMKMIDNSVTAFTLYRMATRKFFLLQPGASWLGAFVLALGLSQPQARAATVWLSALDLSKARVTNNVVPTPDRTPGGKPLSINNKNYARGVCIDSYALFYVQLNGGSDRFSAILGLDDAATNAVAAEGRGTAPPRTMGVRIMGDEGKVLFETNGLRAGGDGVPIAVDLKGVKLLGILVNNGVAAGGRGGRGGSAGGPALYDLAEAKIDVSGARPRMVAIPGEAREVLSPGPKDAPQINGPRLTGVSPGRPVFYKIPVSGIKPITYSVDDLPDGLQVDSARGIISGVIRNMGTYSVTLHARNRKGDARREFKFVAEGRLTLTPALGWNSWNAYGRNVSDALARRAAAAMVSKGLIDHGWTYINLDDGWERSPRQGDALYEGPVRDEEGHFIPNKKFPDMKALGNYIHGLGLKFGIYSSPGPTTCQGLEASFRHEEKDVTRWCSWGVDYLTYDWCSYRAETNGLDGLKKPYQVMRAALNQAPRDIVFSICQYGNGNVWEWGANPDVGGNSWRTTSDIRDNWPQVSAIGFHPGPRGSDVDLSPFAGPGHWNDPDMLVVGVVGWTFEPQHESKLSPAEQLTHFTLWTLYPSPLILGCDLAKADDFTVGLLCNDEVLAIHQDALGKGARAVSKSPNADWQVWARPLEDGSEAVGLFNLNEMPLKVTAQWSDLGLTGQQKVRDVWRQRDIGHANGEFSAVIPRHGCLLLKITPSSASETPKWGSPRSRTF